MLKIISGYLPSSKFPANNEEGNKDRVGNINRHNNSLIFCYLLYFFRIQGFDLKLILIGVR